MALSLLPKPERMGGGTARTPLIPAGRFTEKRTLKRRKYGIRNIAI
jgi:hypothetical protein